ncbi:hypothetical protein AS9A_3265 [Hoyosella subflava DQS3-9A1]|uniref:Uncharacterized protein n=1 Tax=Hoyosella subflava (strain DSM 45089 / JCM 17490 / NBRC 109087 / DQS3-9A1) TaxID=443218 RepID=F6EP49_HOYSD|nr:hypothetical protein AS9A_3265 [Hoyosella subflava DQS3-9A1]
MPARLIAALPDSCAFESVQALRLTGGTIHRRWRSRNW